MNLTNIHKSLLLFFALCSFTSFVFLFQFNTTNGVLAEYEQSTEEMKFGLHYVAGFEGNLIMITSYDMYCAKEAESNLLKKICSSRETLEDITTTATYVTLVFCISLFSVCFFVLEKNELSLTLKIIGIVLGFLYVADVALHGVMLSENDSFYSTLKEGFADQGHIGSWNQRQSMVYIGGSLICHLATPGVILIGFFGYLISLIYSYCKKNNGYVRA